LKYYTFNDIVWWLAIKRLCSNYQRLSKLSYHWFNSIQSWNYTFQFTNLRRHSLNANTRNAKCTKESTHQNSDGIWQIFNGYFSRFLRILHTIIMSKFFIPPGISEARAFLITITAIKSIWVVTFVTYSFKFITSLTITIWLTINIGALCSKC